MGNSSVYALEMNSSVAPLRYGAFRILWASSMLSAAGGFIQAVTGSWLMWEITASNTWVGLMVASSTLPLLVLGLAAGALADMFNRARLMLAAQFVMGGSALAMAILTATDRITPTGLLVLGLVLGIGVAVNRPTRLALLPDLVPRGMIASAVALQSVAFNVARAIGPALGGLIIVTWGPAAGFGINAVTYLAAIIALIVVGRTLVTPERDETSISSAMALGFRFARFTRLFQRLLALTALFAITSASVQAVLPGRNEDLGGTAGTYGLILGAMGAGAVVGAFLRPRLIGRFKARASMLTIVLFGIAGMSVGLASNLLGAGIGMFFSGMFWLLTLTNLNSTAQLLAPEWIRGRVMSMYTLAFGGILPIGSIIAGVTADALGTGPTMVLMSAGTTLLGLTAPIFRIPVATDIKPPEFTDERLVPDHQETVAGGPVMILNTWTVGHDRFEEFTALMHKVRLVRLRTGAYRWRLFRTTTNPHQLTELFLLSSWEEHLAQHRRMDDEAIALIKEARSFDVSGEPRTAHLIALDVDNPPEFDELVSLHDELHTKDGSIPHQNQES